jgi:hypothetical protein
MQRQLLRSFRSFHWSWSAIFAGVFVGLAVETLLLLFGAAIGTSVGDKVLGGGFGVWTVIVTMLGLALGGAVAAFVGGINRAREGAITGFLVWSVIIVLSSTLFSSFGPQSLGTAFWARFFGALVGLACALVGGIAGARFVEERPRRPVITDETLPHSP